MKLRKVRMGGINEVGCLVVDDNGVPIDRICRYTLIDLSGQADTTQANITRHVIHIERWAQKHGVDLEDEVVLGGLSKGELFTSFVRHLERFSDQSSVVSIGTVEPEYFNQRIDASIAYFDYLVSRANARRHTGDPMIIQIIKLAEKLKERLQKRRRHVAKNSQVYGLSLLLQASLYQGLSVVCV